MTPAIAILIVSIANAFTMFYALGLQSRLEKTETKLRQLERRVG